MTLEKSIIKLETIIRVNDTLALVAIKSKRMTPQDRAKAVKEYYSRNEALAVAIKYLKEILNVPIQG